MQANLDAACAAVRASLKTSRSSAGARLIKVRDDWYRRPAQGDQHGPALLGYLRNTKGCEEDSIASRDETSTEVVSLLANPAADQFRCRGLVVGYVQSGKTANMTAVMPLLNGCFAERAVFEADPLDAHDESEAEAGRDMIRLVPDEELGSLRAQRAADKDGFQPDVTRSLEDTILWFLASWAVRRVRGHSARK